MSVRKASWAIAALLWPGGVFAGTPTIKSALVKAGSDPQRLRAVILAHAEAPALPKALMTLVDQTPALSRKRPAIESAILEWKTLPETSRSLLAVSVGEGMWEHLPIKTRAELAEDAARTTAKLDLLFDGYSPPPSETSIRR